MKKVFHFRWFHFGLQFSRAFFQRLTLNECFTIDVKFDERATYNIEGQDASDWNKAGGLSLDLFSTRKTSMMLAWRHYKGKKQICLYSHDKSLRSETNPTGKLHIEEQAITVPEGAEVTAICQMMESGENVMHVFLDCVFVKKLVHRFPPRQMPLFKRIIFAYFGGQQKRKVQYDLEIL